MFPADFRIAAGASVALHTGSGSNTALDLYWNRDTYVWNNQGDTARLRRADWTLADECSYSRTRELGADAVLC
jgi:hypothetical protein